MEAKAAANEVAAAAQQAILTQSCTLAQMQAREADIKALAELTRALDKKVAADHSSIHDNWFLSLLLASAKHLWVIYHCRVPFILCIQSLFRVYANDVHSLMSIVIGRGLVLASEMKLLGLSTCKLQIVFTLGAANICSLYMVSCNMFFVKAKYLQNMPYGWDFIAWTPNS